MIAALFFLIAPPLTFRLKFHYCLANHWLLLAALLVFFQAQQEVAECGSALCSFGARVWQESGLPPTPTLLFRSVAVLAAALVSLTLESAS